MEKLKQKGITIILSLIVSLAPILIILSPTNYNILKYWVLLIGGTLLIGFILANFRNLKIDKKDILILIFLFWVFLSTFFSLDPKKSILGETNRYEGLLTFISYVCIYLASKKFFHYEKIDRFLNLMFYIAMGIGILGIFQNYISNPRLIPLFGKGICATFGNSNFFGSYISIYLPIAIVFFIFQNSKKRICFKSSFVF